MFPAVIPISAFTTFIKVAVSVLSVWCGIASFERMKISGFWGEFTSFEIVP